MVEKYKNKTSFLIAGILALLAGCAAILPTWIKDINDESGTRSLLFGSNETTDRFYKFTYPYASSEETKEGTLTAFDLNGDVLEETSIPFVTPGYTASYKVQELPDASAFLIGTDLVELVYINPVEGVSWNGTQLVTYDENRRLMTFDHHVNVNNELLIRGAIVTTEESGKAIVPFICRVSSAGEILAFEEFPDARLVLLQPVLDSSNYLLTIKYNDSVAAEIQQKVLLQKRKPDLSIIQEYSFTNSFSVYRATEDKLLGIMYLLDSGVFDYEGVKLRDVARSELEGAPYNRPLIGDGVYYDVKVVAYEDGITLYDLPIFVETQGVKVCQFDFDFNNNWCKSSDKSSYVSLINAQVLENNEVAVSYDTESVFLSNIFVGILPNELTFLADLEIEGTVEYQTQHIVYAANGSTNKKADEETYSYSGDLSFGIFSFITVEQERFDAGVSQSFDSLFFSNGSLVSNSIFSDGNDSNRRLTYWE